MTRVFGTFATDDVAARPVCARGQDATAELLEERVPAGGPLPLEEIFRLD